jgi:hypothetical protein
MNVRLPAQMQDKIGNLIKDTVSVGDVDELLQQVVAYLSPEDLFDERELEVWAEGNGYVKKGS